MLVPRETLLLHLDYSRWASLRMLNAAAMLTPEELTRDFGTADKSVLGTLTHIFAADRIWLRRVTGAPPAPFVEAADHDMAVLLRDWPQVCQDWQAWLRALPPESTEHPIEYFDLRGRAFRHEPWKIILHVVNHGTHHRGQISGFLRAMGHTPPPLDLILYYRDLAV